MISVHLRRLEPRPRVFSLVVLAIWLLAIAVPTPAGAVEAFPESPPERVALDGAALDELADIVQGYVDRDMAVGAELLVIKDRQTVLHEAFGWRDREAGIPMEPGTLFNVRSMTKPLTGAAAQLLIDEGKLALDDHVADYLPGFDTDESRGITIAQLLTHTSGLPLTTLTSVDQYPSLQAMADATGAAGPEFEPGSRFWYSDAGADVLGAVIERAAGSSLEDFVTERLLEPLGMEDAYYPGDPDDPRRDRVASLYVGRVGEWSRFWGPDDDPFYPYAWGSQSLYATPAAYARFLAMWLDGGRSGDTRVLSAEAVERTLTPVAPMGQLGSDEPYPTLFDGLVVYHGQMAVLHLDEARMGDTAPAEADPVIVGYSGSDGTIAWAWPDRDLIILYFTQSRGGSTPIRLEAEIQRLLIDPAEGPAVALPPELGDHLGSYTADFGPFDQERFEVIWRDGSLALDIPSQMVFPLEPLEPLDGEDRWTLRGAPGVVVAFTRAEDGSVGGLRIEQGGATYDVPKGAFERGPEPTLTAQEVEPYLGRYRDPSAEREVALVYHQGQLALEVPESPEPLLLEPPDGDGAWRLRIDPSITIRFDEQDGSVVSYTISSPVAEAVFERVESSEG